jgi:hypothetical protein
MNKQAWLWSAATFPMWLSAAPQFPSNQAQFEEALSLPVPILQTMKLGTMGWKQFIDNLPISTLYYPIWID